MIDIQDGLIIFCFVFFLVIHSLFPIPDLLLLSLFLFLFFFLIFVGKVIMTITTTTKKYSRNTEISFKSFIKNFCFGFVSFLGHRGHHKENILEKNTDDDVCYS